MNHFVFVVCGAREHIETLHFSLGMLQRFSKYPVWVVTDSSRNEIPVEHSQVIDIKTPGNYDHHQASIYLKTGLHKFVPDPENGTYCYLDTDVVAISPACDQIFDFRPDPILFASDHCNMGEFSPYAMNCACAKDFERRATGFKDAMNSYFPGFVPNDPEVMKAQKQLMDVFGAMKQHFFRNFLRNIQYLFNRYSPFRAHFTLDNRFVFDRKSRTWKTLNGKMINFDYRYHHSRMLERCGIEFRQGKWINRSGEDITPSTPHCHHLTGYIDQQYHFRIPDTWRHWNGGVFLFNRASFDFLDFWHRITLEEFLNPYTKTRDQGTLAVSAWTFNLQEKPTLPRPFNFITEFNNPLIAFSKEQGFTEDGFATVFEPRMLHIYHEWGHDGWSIWDYVNELSKSKNQE